MSPQPTVGRGFTSEPVWDWGITPPDRPRGGAPHLRPSGSHGRAAREGSGGLTVQKVCFNHLSTECCALFDVLSVDLSTYRPKVARWVPCGARNDLGHDPRPPPGRRGASE